MSQRIIGKEAGADWLQRHLSTEKATAILSPFARTVADIAGQVWRGLYHLDTRQPWRWEDDRVELYIDRQIATWDFDHLSQLVILCHEHCIRFSIEPVMVWDDSRGSRAVVQEWDGNGFHQTGVKVRQDCAHCNGTGEFIIGMNCSGCKGEGHVTTHRPENYKIAMPYMMLVFSPRKPSVSWVEDVSRGHPTIEQAVANARALGAPIPKADAPKSTGPVCKTCNDSHVMIHREDGHEDKEWPCTRCPTPCHRCRGPQSAYCTATPCACDCHGRAL